MCISIYKFQLAHLEFEMPEAGGGKKAIEEKVKQVNGKRQIQKKCEGKQTKLNRLGRCRKMGLGGPFYSVVRRELP